MNRGPLVFLCLSVCLVVPFLHSDRILDPAQLPGWIGVSVVLLGLQGWASFRRKEEIPPPQLRLPMALFGGYCLYGLVPAFFAVNALEGALEWLKAAMTFHLMALSLMIMREAGPVLTRTVLSRSLTGFSIAASGLGFWEYSRLGLHSFELDPVYGITGTFAHKNLFSSILFLASPFCLFSALAEKGKWRMAGLAGLSSSAALLFLLQTRSVWLAMVVSSLCAGVLGTAAFRFGSSRFRMRRHVALLALVLALGTAASVWRAFPEPMKNRWTSIFDVEKHRWRTLLWEKSVSMGHDHPWLGVGPGNWKLHIPRYGLKDLRVVGGVREESEQYGLHPQNPHNDFLWVFSETGIPGFLLYAAFFASLIVACILDSLRSTDRTSSLYAVCLFAAVSGYCVDACFSFPRERIAHSAFLAVIAASISALPAVSIGKTLPGLRMLPLATRPGKVLAVLLPICTLLVGCMRYRSEFHVRKALEARENGRWEEVGAEIDRAGIHTYPLDPFSNPILFYRGIAHFIHGDIGKARKDFERALRTHPYHVHVLNNLGTCLAKEGEYIQALDFFQKAHALEPDYDEVIINAASINFRMKDFGSATAWLERGASDTRNPRMLALKKAVEAERRKAGN